MAVQLYSGTADHPGCTLAARTLSLKNSQQKYSARPITLSHDDILTNGLLRVNRGTLQMRIAVSRE
jgi:hypothetical protein